MKCTTRTILLDVLLLFCLASVSAGAQQSPVLTTPLPSDPAAILALAAKYNGLASPDIKPWYLKATYEVYDQTGQPRLTSTFEEWWAGPKNTSKLMSVGALSRLNT